MTLNDRKLRFYRMQEDRSCSPGLVHRPTLQDLGEPTVMMELQ